MESSRSDFPDLINIRQFVQNWMAVLSESDIVTDPKLKIHDYIDKEMGISRQMIEELDSVCKPSNLDCEGEPDRELNYEEKVKIMSKIPDFVNLVTTGLQKKSISSAKVKKNARRLRYYIDDSPWLHTLKSSQCTNIPEEETVQHPEALITVHVHKPYIINPYLKRSELKIIMMLQVLGSQKLTDLRDAIVCPSDLAIQGEFSNGLDLPREPLAKDLFKSGFFFIENTFYNDMRDPDCRDYSRVIRDWSSDPRRGLGAYSTCKMEDFTLEDLSVRLGYPYLYLHQGNCEHLITFNDIRLIHSFDCQDLREYPMVTGRCIPKHVICRICQSFSAEWLVRESPHCPEDPCALCDTCFRMLHYDKDGTKVGNFQVYPFNTNERNVYMKQRDKQMIGKT